MVQTVREQSGTMEQERSQSSAQEDQLLTEQSAMGSDNSKPTTESSKGERISTNQDAAIEESTSPEYVAIDEASGTSAVPSEETKEQAQETKVGIVTTIPETASPGNAAESRNAISNQYASSENENASQHTPKSAALESNEKIAEHDAAPRRASGNPVTQTLLLSLPIDSLHCIASFLSPAEWASFSQCSKGASLVGREIFRRVRMHGFRCATEVVTAWVSFFTVFDMDLFRNFILSLIFLFYRNWDNMRMPKSFVRYISKLEFLFILMPWAILITL